MTKGVLVIAEAGVNHNGDLAVGRRLIDVVAESGADLVKFQSFSAHDASYLALVLRTGSTLGTFDTPLVGAMRQVGGETSVQPECRQASTYSRTVMLATFREAPVSVPLIRCRSGSGRLRGAISGPKTGE